jgi:hypothetical protein
LQWKARLKWQENKTSCRVDSVVGPESVDEAPNKLKEEEEGKECRLDTKGYFLVTWMPCLLLDVSLEMMMKTEKQEEEEDQRNVSLPSSDSHVHVVLHKFVFPNLRIHLMIHTRVSLKWRYHSILYKNWKEFWIVFQGFKDTRDLSMIALLGDKRVDKNPREMQVETDKSRGKWESGVNDCLRYLFEREK